MRCGALVSLMLLGACEDPQPVPRDPTAQTPRTVAVASIAAEQLVDAVLDECHRPLRGRMQRISAVVTDASGHEELVLAELPDRLRVQDEAGKFLLLGDACYRLDEQPLTAEQINRIKQLRLLVDAAAFGPLYRHATCRRIDEHTFVITTNNDREWRLKLRPNTLLPHSLTHGKDVVTFDEYLRRPTTWVARGVTSSNLGTCKVVFEDGGIRWSDDFFAKPADRPHTGRLRIATPGANVESQSAFPKVEALTSSQWVVIADPGTWPERVQAYREVYDELQRQNQRIAGFPMFFTEDGQAKIAQRFQQRRSQPVFVPPDDWNLRNVAAGRQLYVHPPTGDLQQRITDGIAALQRELQRRGLTARSPITAQPFLHLHKGEPSADKLAAPTVRVSVAID